jgi:hypothetical protein
MQMVMVGGATLMVARKSVEEQVDIHLKRVESAGTSTNALGWISFPVSVGVVLLVSSDVEIMYYTLFFMTFLSLYLIWSGKYIKGFSGKHVRSLLFMNGLICLLLARGIIPLIVCIQSFMGFYSYGKADRLDDELVIKSESSSLNGTELMIFIVMVLIMTFVTVIRAHNIKN